MIPINLTEAKGLEALMSMEIPFHLRDSLIGKRIDNTDYFKVLEGDPTNGHGGYNLNPQGVKIYKIEHQPTGSTKRYRKLNHIKYGECWEVIPEGV